MCLWLCYNRYIVKNSPDGPVKKTNTKTTVIIEHLNVITEQLVVEVSHMSNDLSEGVAQVGINPFKLF